MNCFETGTNKFFRIAIIVSGECRSLQRIVQQGEENKSPEGNLDDLWWSVLEYEIV